jgi:hypothetical protein
MPKRGQAVKEDGECSLCFDVNFRLHVLICLYASSSCCSICCDVLLILASLAVAKGRKCAWSRRGGIHLCPHALRTGAPVLLTQHRSSGRGAAQRHAARSGFCDRNQAARGYATRCRRGEARPQGDARSSLRLSWLDIIRMWGLAAARRDPRVNFGDGPALLRGKPHGAGRGAG